MRELGSSSLANLRLHDDVMKTNDRLIYFLLSGFTCWETFKKHSGSDGTERNKQAQVLLQYKAFRRGGGHVAAFEAQETSEPKFHSLNKEENIKKPSLLEF